MSLIVQNLIAFLPANVIADGHALLERNSNYRTWTVPW